MLISYTFVILYFASVFIFTDAQLLKNKMYDNRRRENPQYKYNDELM